MILKIKSRLIDSIYRHAMAEYPREACGVVIGKKGISDSFEQSFPCMNLQDQMHASDPKSFPRTAETAYFLNPKDLLQVQRMARERNMEVKIIYHSHVNVGAYFSEEDKKQSLYEGVPMFPGVYYLVANATQNPTRELAKIFGWDELKKDFVEIPWEAA